MALNFPSSPTVGQTHDATNGLSYYYDGVKWTVQGTYASSAGSLKKIDDISSGFNGNTKTFNLHHNGIDISVSNALDVLISVGGVIQEPVIAYDVNPAASTITFTGAPPSGVTFFGILKSKFADQNVTPNDDTVDTIHLKTGAVTTVKIADNTVNGDKLTDNIDIAGTLDVTGATTLDSTLGVVGNVSVNTNKFTVAGSDGDTAIAGTLAVTGTSTFTGGTILPKASNTLTSSDTFAVSRGWHEIDADGNPLTTITGGTPGQILLITVAGEDLVVTDTAVGGGANTIVGGVTLDLSEGDTLLLMFDGTQWRKIAHGDN